MENEFLDSVEDLINNKRYKLDIHKEASKMAKEGLKKHNYVMTNTELLYFHEVEILMLMAGVRKLHNETKRLNWQNLLVLTLNVALLISLIIR